MAPSILNPRFSILTPALEYIGKPMSNIECRMSKPKGPDFGFWISDFGFARRAAIAAWCAIALAGTAWSGVLETIRAAYGSERTLSTDFDLTIL